MKYLSLFKRNRVSPLGLVAATLLASSLLLTGCGGGDGSSSFYLTALVGGQNMGSYGTGSSGTLYVRAGQYFELDANEPVVWTLYVGDTAVTGTGTSIQYAGAVVTLTAESDSRIAVDTYGTGPLIDPVPVTLVATSTYDSARVATVNTLITN
jgi:hypothetical protein